MDPSLEMELNLANLSQFSIQKVLKFFPHHIGEMKEDNCFETKKVQARTNVMTSNSNFFVKKSQYPIFTLNFKAEKLSHFSLSESTTKIFSRSH